MSKNPTTRKIQEKAPFKPKKRITGPLDKMFERLNKSGPKKRTWKDYALELEDAVIAYRNISISRAKRIEKLDRYLARLQRKLLEHSQLSQPQRNELIRLCDSTSPSYTGYLDAFSRFTHQNFLEEMSDAKLLNLLTFCYLNDLTSTFLDERNKLSRVDQGTLPAWYRVDGPEWIIHDAAAYDENHSFPTGEEFVPERPENLK